MNYLSILVLTLLVTWTLPSSASFGTKLHLDADSSGTPDIGFTYLPDEGGVLMATFNFRANQIISSTAYISPVYMTIINRDTNEVLLPWMQLDFRDRLVAPNEELGFYLEVVDQAWLKPFAAQFKRTVLVLSFQQPLVQAAPVAYIDFAELCQLKIPSGASVAMCKQ